MSNVIFLPDSPILLHSFKDSVTAWDTSEGRLCYKCTGALLGITADGELFQTTKGTWATDTGEELSEVPELFNWHHRLRIIEVEIPIDDEKSKSPTDRRRWSYNIDIIDPRGERPHQRLHINDLNDLGGIRFGSRRIDSSGNYLAVYLYVSLYGHELDQGICYNLSTGKEIFRYGYDDLTFVEVHRLIIYSSEAGLKIYNVDSGQTMELAAFSESKDRNTIRVSSQNLEMAAALNHKRNIIFLEKVNQAAFRRMIRKRAVKILDIALSADGTQLAASLSDGQVHIWDVESGKVTMKLAG
jgi:WD40 repeat protein